MHAALQKLATGEILSRGDAGSLLREIAAGKASHDEIVQFLTSFRTRLPTAAEFSGFRDAMLSVATPLHIDRDLLDMCGTGGDGKNTFNISTATAFVVASCGIAVAKHGNYGSSSICGSSNVLEALAIPFPKTESEVCKQLEVANLTFLHAPLWHPAMRVVAVARKQLGFKTIFNLLGPVVNPCWPKYQVMGVHSPELQQLYSETLAGEDLNFAVLRSDDGYDEISLTASATIRYPDRTKIVSADDFGAKSLRAEALIGGKSIQENAFLLEHVLSGEGTDEQTSVVAANTAVALSLRRTGEDLKSLYAEAIDAMHSGRVFERLQLLRGLA